MNDNRFSAPMIRCHAGDIFCKDFIVYRQINEDSKVGKVKKFYMKVIM